MIQTFKHRGLRAFHERSDSKLLNSQRVKRIKRILDALDVAETIEVVNFPGYDLHELKGSRKGTWSIKVSGNWRITFRFENGNAYDVNLEDYH
jgi:toxin HigB-1